MTMLKMPYLLLVVTWGVVVAAQTSTSQCVEGSAIPADKQELARYLFELRNNRQQECSPPDFVVDPKGEVCEDSCISYGFEVLKVCSEPKGQVNQDPAVEVTEHSVTVKFNDICSKNAPKTITIQARTWQCPGMDLLLQPTNVYTIQKKVMPADFKCQVGQPLSIEEEQKDLDFTDSWEFDHALEAAVKYKLLKEDKTSVIACNAYNTAALTKACYDKATGAMEGYGTITYSCPDGKETKVSYYLNATYVGRSKCPWPEILPASGVANGYNSNFTFTAQSGSNPTAVVTPTNTNSSTSSGALSPSPASAKPVDTAKLSSCLSDGGLSVVSDAASSLQWNKLYDDTKPIGVVYPTSIEQVQATVRCARAANIRVTARSGGGGAGGYSVNSSALTICFSKMRQVRISQDKTTITIQGGARHGDVYYGVNIQSNGTRAVVGGTCTNIGIGATLGGGVGFLSRRDGLACDQLVSLKMVDYKGDVIVASATNNTDLFWASCGAGGGQFGLVAEYEIRTVPIPPKVTLIDYTVPAGTEAAFMQSWQINVISNAKPELEMVVTVGSEGGMDVGWQYQGSSADARKELQALGVTLPKDAELKEVTWIDSIIKFSYMDFTAPEKMTDLSYYDAIRPYWKIKSGYAKKPISEADVKKILDWAKATGASNVNAYVEMTAFGPRSAIAKRAVTDTAFPHRDALFQIAYASEYSDSAQSSQVTSALKEIDTYLKTKAGVSNESYVNYVDTDFPNAEAAWEAYYGGNVDRLIDVKTKYDPENYFVNAQSLRAKPTANGDGSKVPPSGSVDGGKSPAGGSPSSVPSSSDGNDGGGDKTSSGSVVQCTGITTAVFLSWVL